ncbi:AAA family ATPase [Lentibacillus sp. N15]|uniref:ATP-binding protein n=1 Tax=Lentibacillus songyuanensis TaxID=3136161 RepID=UPI0031BAA1E8
MIIIRAAIDGFGKWYDKTIEFSPDRLNCLYGENESGKSTLYQFILFMLFGLPPRKREMFRPKTGAKMGGRLQLYDAELGEYTIERYDAVKNGAAVCYMNDGQVQDEAWLKDRLNAMTYETYQSIFSFSAEDLAGLSAMKEADLGDILLSIGLTGSKNIQSIEKRLDAQIADLFKPYGKKPAINQQLASLYKWHVSLKDAEQKEATYRGTKDSVKALETEIAQQKAVLQQEKQLLAACEKKLQALSLIQQYQHYANQLHTFPDAIAFPEDGIKRFNAVKEQLLPLKSELTVLQENLQTYRQKQEQLTQSLVSNTLYKQASKLLEESESYIETEKELKQLNEAYQQKKMRQETLLDQLNIGLGLDDLNSIVLAFHTEETWNKLVSETNQIQLEWEQYEQEERVTKRQHEELVTQQEQVRVQVLTDSYVQELTDTVHMYQHQTYAKKLTDRSDNAGKWQLLKRQKEKTARRILIWSFIAAMLPVAGLAFLDMKIMLPVVLIIIAIGIGSKTFLTRSIKEMEYLLKPQQGQATPPTVTQEAYTKAKLLLETNDQQMAELATIRDQLKANEASFLTLAERKNMLEVKQQRINQQMEQQCKIYPFLMDVELPYWTSLYHSLRSVLQLYTEGKQLCQKRKQLYSQMETFQQELHMFFQAETWELTSKTVPEQIEKLKQLIHRQQKTNEQIAQYESWITANLSQQETINQRMRVYQKELGILYESADVNTEEAFFQKASESERRNQLQTKLTETNEQLSFFFSKEEWEKLRDASLNEQVLEEEREQHVTAIEAVEATLDAKRQELADLNAELARMEDSGLYSQLLHRFHMEQEQLEELAQQWSVLKTAKALLMETKQDYRDKYLAKVMAKTAVYFAALTNNRYSQVFAPKDERPMEVLAVDHTRYTVSELSRGTTDQLYVSLRIAISEVMSEKHSLPFIIDDAFVHFDLLRSENMMKILAEITKNQQILLFTCKNEIINTVYNENIVHLENTVRIS